MEPNKDLYDRRSNRSKSVGADVEQRDDQRRQTTRLALRLWTEGRSEGRLDFHNCSNLSVDGIFIETTSPYPLHEIVDIEFNLPGVHEPVSVRARVVSALDEGNAGASIMGNGFTFEHLAASELKLIQSYIDAAQLAGV